MEYRIVGKSGLKVTPICVGTAFRSLSNGQYDEITCIRVIERAVDIGLNFFDCANVYSAGRSEEILGKALRGMSINRDNLVVTSKVGLPTGEGSRDRGSSRSHIMREIDRSLERLRLDHVDIYLIHVYDPDTTMEETFRAMDDLVCQGKIRYFGISNFTAAQVVEALWTCDRPDLHQPLILQNQYSLVHRLEVESELLRLCRRHGLGMMTHSALGIGLLSGRYRRGQPPPSGTFWAAHAERFKEVMTDRIDAIIQALIDIGGAHGKSPVQVAIAWIVDHPEVTSAVIGPDLPEHIDDAYGALGWRLPNEARQRLDEISKPEVPKRFDRV